MKFNEIFFQIDLFFTNINSIFVLLIFTTMPRPAKQESKYNVHIRRDGGHTYLFSHVAIDNDNKAGKKKWQKVQWGTLDDDNVFHPFTRYFTYGERDLLKFPDGCDLSVAKALLKSALSPKVKTSRNADFESLTDGELLQYQNKLYGDIWLLDRIAEQQYVIEDLLSVFDNNSERVKRILTIAYYIIAKADSLNHIVRWQNIEKTPTDFKLTPTSVTELVQSIKEVHRMRFLKRMTSRVDMSSKEFVAVDTSTITCESENLPEVKMGFSKEGGTMIQTIIVVVYSLTTHIPVYYDVIQGNMPDSRGLEQIRRTITAAGFLGITFIIDRGYFTFQNIGMLLKEKIPAIMAAKTSDAFIKNIIKEIKLEDGCVPSGMDIDIARKIYYRQYQIKPEEISPTLKSYKKHVYLNLYFNPEVRSDFVTNLRATIEYERQRLESVVRDKEIVDSLILNSECRHFKIVYYKKSGRVRSYTLNEKKVEEEKFLVGYFANLEVNLKLTPIEANEHYRLRDEQEKSFEGRKTRFNFDRLRCSSEESLRGREFILFVASILLSHLRRLWRDKIKSDKVLHKKYPTEIDILDEMRSIRYIKYEGEEGYITPFVGAQLELCRLFNIDIPEGCGPASRK